jgi:hypothetical protein
MPDCGKVSGQKRVAAVHGRPSVSEAGTKLMKPFWLPRPEREMAADTAGAGVPQVPRISRDIAEALEQLPHYHGGAFVETAGPCVFVEGAACQ